MSLLRMTWKSTAVASGAMVVATWLASHAPVGRPREQPTSAPSPSRTETAAAEIQREADRLHSRLNRVASYKFPSRDPFQFSARPAARAIPRQPVMSVTESLPSVVAQPPTLRMMLSGIGEDVVGDQVVRTAIISTPDNVHIVKIGDTIGDIYKVTTIDADAVELTRLEDGSAVRLSLRR
jgi:hypothetical protein